MSLLNDRQLTAVAEDLGQTLLARSNTVTTAESCTGGWVARVITDIAGSSQWFDCGLVTYSDRAKQELLGVTAATLTEHGAVSAAVVAQMAAGARRVAQADWAVAVSGIAGPGGGSASKPVGLVWFGWCGDGHSDCQAQSFSGDREAVRRAAVAYALTGLLQRVEARRQA